MKCKHYFRLVTALGLMGILQGCLLVSSDMTTEQTVDARLDFSDPVLNQRRVILAGEITESSAAKVIREMLYLDALTNQPIDLYLLTPGGDLEATLAIERTMRSLRSPVNTWALGECSSGGAMLLAAGTGERRAFKDSIILVHGVLGASRLPRKHADLEYASVDEFWKHYARLPESWVPIPPGKWYILNAEQARTYGVIDKIIDRPAPKTAAH
jgi:ATP-dependent Clp protease protease subunit